jgi:hypothetical protein
MKLRGAARQSLFAAAIDTCHDTFSEGVVHCACREWNRRNYFSAPFAGNAMNAYFVIQKLTIKNVISPH